jgi:diguanylate cyclase (GGDEF)-like protein
LPISLLIADIDHFKDYNDTYGHQQGDAALHSAAQLLVSSLARSTDFAARWGGEEFVALLPHTDEAGALNVAEKIRKSLEETIIPLADGQPTKMTMSVGINSLVPAKGSSVTKFVSGADKALYAAKKAGRNRPAIYDPADDAGKTIKVIRQNEKHSHSKQETP